jgi:ribonuclease Z
VSARELVVLGTASQVPTRHRNHNGYLLLWDGQGILFDPGEGTQRQMLFAGVSAGQITRICISHFHGDHCLGLAGIVQRVSLDRVPHEIPVHYPASGQVYLDRLRRASIFKDEARIAERPLRRAGLQEQGALSVSALPLEHTVDSWGYRLQEPDGITLDPARLEAAGIRGPEIGRLVREGSIEIGGRRLAPADVGSVRRGRSVAFVMDTRRCRNAVELARGADLLIIESTYLESEAREAHERGHLTARAAAEIAVEAGAARVVLTHFSQRHPSVEPFLDEAGAVHDDVIAAEDGVRIRLGR